LYSAKIKDGKLFKIKKLDLLSSNWKKELNSYLGKGAENKESVWAYRNDRQLYDKLCVIYNDNDGEKNPFFEYVKKNNYDAPEKQKIIIEIENRKKPIYIRYLKCWGREIKEGSIFKQTKLKPSVNKVAFFELFKSLGAKYEITNNVPSLLPINIKNHNFQLLQQKNKIIWRGTILKEKISNQNYYVTGIRTIDNKLEIKPIDHIPLERKLISARDVQNKYTIVSLDELGNEYKIL
jgi:hypothetical protein